VHTRYRSIMSTRPALHMNLSGFRKYFWFLHRDQMPLDERYIIVSYGVVRMQRKL
jgi:hypothetical protein